MPRIHVITNPRDGSLVYHQFWGRGTPQTFEVVHTWGPNLSEVGRSERELVYPPEFANAQLGELAVFQEVKTSGLTFVLQFNGGPNLPGRDAVTARTTNEFDSDPAGWAWEWGPVERSPLPIVE
jgi:hypothetical protein